MNPEAVFNRYDIRGAYPDEIDEDFAERLGVAVGHYAQKEQAACVVTGKDTRDSSRAIYDAFLTGLRRTGVHVTDTGIGTTDRTALAAHHYNGIGVMVTASHHAWKRTGFKLLYPNGHGFSNQDMDRVKTLFLENNVHGDTAAGAMLQVQDEFDETYTAVAKKTFQTFVGEELDARVVLDAVGGAERFAPVLFEELGATIQAVERETPPAPEPAEETRQDVARALTKSGADIAVGYDPDADRVYVLHPEQGWLNGDDVFYLLARIIQPDVVVASLDTSPMIESLDASIHYTRVGDVFVAETGVEVDADLLGEPNGHYAVTDFCWYNSGIFASLLLAAYAANIPELLDPVQEWETIRHVETFKSMKERDEAMSHVMKHVAKEYDVLSTADGIKFETHEVTGLVRPSGTAPKIRLGVHGEGDITEQVNQIRAHVFSDG